LIGRRTVEKSYDRRLTSIPRTRDARASNQARPTPGGLMKRARLILLGFLVLGVVQVPTTALAEHTVVLPAGTWDVTATVTSKDAAHNHEFGLYRPPTEGKVCPPGAGGCAPGDARTFEGLSGELVFYLRDIDCDATFFSTDHSSALVTGGGTNWTIGWDDAGNCSSRDGDRNDLVVSVIAHGAPTDHDQAFYDGTQEVTLATARDTAEGFYSKLVIPPGLEGPTVVSIDEYPASGPVPGVPTPATFCGGRPCDAQIQITVLPEGETSATNPIQVFWFYTKGTGGNLLYVKGDNELAASLVKDCVTAGVANPPKCRSSITQLPNKTRQYLMLWRDGGDPAGAKRR
jgi:hypothetical protein